MIVKDLLPNNIYALGQQVPQIEGETDLAYVAFLHWIQRGCPTNAELASVTRLSRESLEDWRVRYEWRKRLDESPAAAQAQIVARRIQNSVDMLAQETKASQRIMLLIERTLTKVFIADTLTDMPVVGIRDLATLLKVVHEYERLEEGKSTQNVSVEENSIDKSKLDELSVEELLLLKKVAPKLVSGGNQG